MKKLASITRNQHKPNQYGNLKSNRDHLKHCKTKEIRDYVQASSNKNTTYNTIIKSMLNGCANTSTPSMSAHRARLKNSSRPRVKGVGEQILSVYNKAMQGASKKCEFNNGNGQLDREWGGNTQKINIKSHLGCLDLRYENEAIERGYESYKANFGQASNNKFKVAKGKENLGYSYGGKRVKGYEEYRS